MTEPYAEAAVLGAVMLDADPAKAALLQLTDDDFDTSQHRAIAAAARSMIRDRRPIDALTLGAELERSGEIRKVGGTTELFALMHAAPVPESASYYAEIVRNRARLRKARVVSGELARMLAADGAGEQLDQVMLAHRAALESIPEPLGATAHEITIGDLMNEPETPAEWITPGLIARGERIVLTGPEGLAKSTLMRQFAGCLAAGLHPWTGKPYAEPVRVLHIDAENSRAQTRRSYQRIDRFMRETRVSPDWRKRITVRIEPAGLDLTGRDAGWLHQAASRCSPDVIVLGPAYKLSRGDPQKDSDVLALLAVIDEVRMRHNAAVLIEQHTPHGNSLGERPIRPYGSSVWLRWPEVGLGLRRDTDKSVVQEERPRYLEVPQWRGAREPRDWPGRICWGTEWAYDPKFRGRPVLPWVPTDSNYQPTELEAA